MAISLTLQTSGKLLDIEKTIDYSHIFYSKLTGNGLIQTENGCFSQMLFSLLLIENEAKAE